MRNTQYPEHTIGKARHSMFSLSDTPGLIQGITHIETLEKIGADAFTNFEHLPEGKSHTFETSSEIEVIEFTGFQSRYGGYVDQIFKKRITLEKGAKITGPIVWKNSESPSPSDPTKNEKDGSLLAPLLVILGCVAIAWWIEPKAGIALGGLLSLFTLFVLAFDFFAENKLKRIAKLGSTYILSPKKKSWA